MNRALFTDDLHVGIVSLDAAESHYARTVMRLALGAAVRVADGRGGEGQGRLVAAAGKALAVEVTELATAQVSASSVVVLLGLPKPALVDEALQLGTEAGLSGLWLFPTAYSPPGRPKLERLERIALAATRQCRRAVRPSVRWFDNLQAALSALEAEASLFGCSRWVGAPEADAVLSVRHSGAVIAVGPEGGFSPIESQQLRAANFLPVGLGPHILRAPTAVAIATALAVNRW